MVAYMTRSTWGATAWKPTPATVPASMRTEFLVHYNGASAPPSGAAMCRYVERIHIEDRGWAGIGYNFLVDNADGRAYEGRGWDLQGAHCRDHNTSGIGVYVGISGDQTPSPAALRTVRALYDEACRRSGKTLRKTWHGANYATECPGPRLIAWVKAGMPVDGTTTTTSSSTPEDDDMPTEKEISAGVWGTGSAFVVPIATGTPELKLADGRPAISPISAIARTMYGVDALAAQVSQLTATLRAQPPAVDVGALAAAIVAKLPAGGVAVDPQALARAVLTEMARAVQDQ